MDKEQMMITLKPFDIDLIKIDKEMPVTSKRIIITKEEANKLSNWKEEKKGLIDSSILHSFNPSLNLNDDIPETIEIEEEPLNNMVNNEPSEIIDTISNVDNVEPLKAVDGMDVIDTKVEQPVIEDNEDDDFIFDDGTDQEIYEASKTM